MTESFEQTLMTMGNGSAYISVQNEVNNSHEKLFISGKLSTIQMKYQGLQYLASKRNMLGAMFFR